MKFSKVKTIFKDRRVLLLLLVGILILLLLDFNQRMILLSKLRGQEKQLNITYAELEATRSSLETQIAYAGSDEAVEKWAREEAGLVQPGDVPIVLLPPSTPPQPPAAQPAPPPDKIEKWEIWQELFFGN